MNILYVWFDRESRQERAKLYRNIDPESIQITGGKMYFAHVGVHTPGAKIRHGHYEISVGSWNWAFVTTDQKEIEETMKEFRFTGDLGYKNIKEGY